MEIAIFNKITTEGVITSIEENSKKYHVGFYADMNNAPERKLVKESASEIGGIIKELEAARISITKANTLAVNKEHKLILERLMVANAPFQVLIDEYAAQRKKILADEKRVIELRAAMVQKEDDHEMGLLINKTFEYDRQEEIKAQAKHEEILRVEREEYADQQVKAAIKQQENQLKKEEQSNINAENARLANKEHVRGVNNSAVSDLIEAGLDQDTAQIAVRAIARKLISSVTINY
jgi:sulfur relay (sulfurtransferase) DsrC/TusE family protein